MHIISNIKFTKYDQWLTSKFPKENIPIKMHAYIAYQKLEDHHFKFDKKRQEKSRNLITP
jgi:hypothetical protein